MIPKIIHYCWFGKGLMPKSQQDCIKSWKRMLPDYKIMRWDESTFDYNKYSASRYAYKVKKYALVSDVCRYNVLSEYGGIYLDTDVEVFQTFDPYLNATFFSAIEMYNEFHTENSSALLDANGNPLVVGTEIPHLEMLTSTMGCVPGNLLIGELRDYYNNIEANEEYAINYRNYVNNDRLVAKYAAQYGFRYVNEKQTLANSMVIYPTGIFGYKHCPNPDYSVAYHYNAASWISKTKRNKFRYLLDQLHLMNFYKKIRSIKNKIVK